MRKAERTRQTVSANFAHLVVFCKKRFANLWICALHVHMSRGSNGQTHIVKELAGPCFFLCVLPVGCMLGAAFLCVPSTLIERPWLMGACSYWNWSTTVVSLAPYKNKSVANKYLSPASPSSAKQNRPTRFHAPTLRARMLPFACLGWAGTQSSPSYIFPPFGCCPCKTS